MSKQTINIGASPNDGTGTPLRTSFDYCNQNFTELYTATGPSGNNIVVPGNATITGDLTVRTNKLFVNATGVGIGNNGPLSVLTVSSQVGARLSVRTTNAIFGTVSGGSGFDSLDDAGSTLVPFGCRGSTITLGSSAGIGFQIDASGNATWQNVGGVAGTAMTLNSTGLGIGVASPSTLLYVQKSQSADTTLVVSNENAGTAATARLDLRSNVSNYLTLQSYGQNYVGNVCGIAAAKLNTILDNALTANSSGLLIGTVSTNPLYFVTANAVKMTLDTSGNLLVGTTSALGSGSTFQNLGTARNVLTLKSDAFGSYTMGVWNASTTNDGLFQYFATETSLNVRGGISYNRAGGLVAYNTTSDYRAKDIIGPVSNSGSLIDSLKVYVGKMKGATIERPMLIAHEAQEVAPYAVTGLKDEVDADGKDKYQQMDVSSFVPLLIAEIQSLRARVQTLEAR